MFRLPARELSARETRPTRMTTLQSWQYFWRLYNEASVLTNRLEAHLDSREAARSHPYAKKLNRLLDLAWQRQKRRANLYRKAEAKHFEEEV